MCGGERGRGGEAIAAALNLSNPLTHRQFIEALFILFSSPSQFYDIKRPSCNTFFFNWANFGLINELELPVLSKFCKIGLHSNSGVHEEFTQGRNY